MSESTIAEDLNKLHADLLQEVNDLVVSRLRKLTYYKIEHSLHGVPTITVTRAAHVKAKAQ
jgi:hypothetical protein